MNLLSRKTLTAVLLGGVATLALGSAAFADHDRFYDNRYHHDHYYYPHGHVADVLPRAAITVRVGGGPFYFHEGVWYRPRGARFIVAAPPFGVVIPVLPPFYTTLWVRGIPYYYANDVYYTSSPDQRGYVVTNPPADSDVTLKSAAAAKSDDLFIYPKSGQSEQQQSSDRYDCHTWANDQTHYDPTRPGGGVAANESDIKRADYFRAMTACLEGRGYTVK